MIKYKITKINDSKVSTLQEKYPNINENDLKRIVSLDPTARIESDYAGQYGDWLVLMLSKGETFNEPLELTRTLELYNKVKNKVDVQYRNIFNFKSLEEFKKFVQESGKTDLSVSEMKNNKPEGADVIYKNATCTVWHPTTYEASKWIRGNNAVWCTGDHRSDAKWEDYSSEGNIYIIISNSNKDEKYQFYIPNGSNIIKEFKDANNNLVNMKKIIEKFDLMPFLEQFDIDKNLIDIERLYNYLFDLKNKGNGYVCEQDIRDYAYEEDLDEEAVIKTWYDWVNRIHPYTNEDEAYKELNYYKDREEYLKISKYSEYSIVANEIKKGNGEKYKNLFTLNINDFLNKLNYYKIEQNNNEEGFDYKVIDRFISNVSDWFTNNYYRLGIYKLFTNNYLIKRNQLIDLYNCNKMFAYEFFLNEKENVASLLNKPYNEIKNEKICKKFRQTEDYACTVEQMIRANYLLTEPFFRINRREFENQNCKIKFIYLSLEEFLNEDIIKFSFADSLIEFENYKKVGLENLYLQIMNLYKEDLLDAYNIISKNNTNTTDSKYKITKIYDVDDSLPVYISEINLTPKHVEAFSERFNGFFEKMTGRKFELKDETSAAYYKTDFMNFCDTLYHFGKTKDDYESQGLDFAVKYFFEKSRNIRSNKKEENKDESKTEIENEFEYEDDEINNKNNKFSYEEKVKQIREAYLKDSKYVWLPCFDSVEGFENGIFMLSKSSENGYRKLTTVFIIKDKDLNNVWGNVQEYILRGLDELKSLMPKTDLDFVKRLAENDESVGMPCLSPNSKLRSLDDSSLSPSIKEKLKANNLYRFEKIASIIREFAVFTELTYMKMKDIVYEARNLFNMYAGKLTKWIDRNDDKNLPLFKINRVDIIEYVSDECKEFILDELNDMYTTVQIPYADSIQKWIENVERIRDELSNSSSLALTFNEINELEKFIIANYNQVYGSGKREEYISAK